MQYSVDLQFNVDVYCKIDAQHKNSSFGCQNSSFRCFSGKHGQLKGMRACILQNISLIFVARFVLGTTTMVQFLYSFYTVSSIIYTAIGIPSCTQ